MELLGVPENYALVLGAHLRTPPAAFAPQERGAVLANATDVYLLGFVPVAPDPHEADLELIFSVCYSYGLASNLLGHNSYVPLEVPPDDREQRIGVSALNQVFVGIYVAKPGA